MNRLDLILKRKKMLKWLGGKIFGTKAETKEDAIKRVRELGLDKTDVYNVIDDDMFTLDADYLYDTEELMSVEENDGQPTVEVYYDDEVSAKDELICGNAD